jgi:7-cyano-7-deazaguanine synthase
MARAAFAAPRRRWARRPRPGAVCVLASGGLDSAVLLAETSRTYRSVQPLYIRAGLRWEDAEIRALRGFVRAVEAPRLAPPVVLSLPLSDLYGAHWSVTGRRVPGFDSPDANVYLPGRNIALLSKAAVFCASRGIPVLVTGILRANPFPDGSRTFLRAMERALSAGLGTPIRIRAPYRGLTKAQVIRRGAGLPLARTLSCGNPRGALHCGRCSKCGERARAFRAAGVADPTRYAGGPGAASAGRGAVPPGAKRARTTRQAAKKPTISR